MPLPTIIKPVSWLGNTKQDLSGLAEDVKDEVGQALFEAQKGGRHSSVKPLRGYGDASVLEVVSDYSGDTFRVVYTVRWPEQIYVLHVFQKKSKSGSKTPKSDLNLIDARLKRLTELYAEQAKLSKGAKK
jgi:phage-related protein